MPKLGALLIGKTMTLVGIPRYGQLLIMIFSEHRKILLLLSLYRYGIVLTEKKWCDPVLKISIFKKILRFLTELCF